MKSEKKRTAARTEHPRAFTLKGAMSEYSSRALHEHRYHQILTIRSGVTLLEDRTGRRPLYGRMCAFLPAGIPHRSVVVGGEVVYQSLYVCPTLFRRAGDSIVIFTAGELSSALFNHLARRKKSPIEGADRKALDLFIVTSRADMTDTPFRFALPSPRSDECARIVRFIESNYARKLSLGDFRTVLPYTDRHITRLFRDEMRITPYGYLRLFRAFSASVALADHGRKIIEIAFSCGYESLSAFYTDFREYFGRTPKEFRRATDTRK